MKSGTSNGKTVAIFGIVLGISLLVVWLATDTLVTIGLIIGAGLFFGGLILMRNERRAIS